MAVETSGCARGKLSLVATNPSLSSVVPGRQYYPLQLAQNWFW